MVYVLYFVQLLTDIFYWFGSHGKLNLLRKNNIFVKFNYANKHVEMRVMSEMC